MFLFVYVIAMCTGFLYNILASIIFYTVPTGRDKLKKSANFD